MKQICYTKMGRLLFNFAISAHRSALTEWTVPAVKALFKVLLKQTQLFVQRKIGSKRQVFDNCSVYLRSKGFKYTSAQCENKWKSSKRRYMSVHNRLLTGEVLKSSPFDEQILAIISAEKPSFQQESDELSKVNLNIPPGFAQKPDEIKMSLNDDEDRAESIEDYADPNEQGYSTSYENLVELVLQDTDSINAVNASKVEILNEDECLSPENDDNDAQQPCHEETWQSSNNEDSEFITEVRELRKAMKRSLDHNAQLLKANNATHEQLLITLTSLDKREEEKMEIKRKKLEKQGELLQQAKIKNSLMAKLIQKIGNFDTSK
ncbi:hypothetical protein HUJ04_007355 [Dendroctonus ponderosae]|nr:hypothetical protein HUJ04_007355 [Dendroctonus ponderosae]KAH1025398.1 hypothetical protein HUJ05_010131 [Dendroctonus ponderosae]